MVLVTVEGFDEIVVDESLVEIVSERGWPCDQEDVQDVGVRVILKKFMEQNVLANHGYCLVAAQRVDLRVVFGIWVNLVARTVPQDQRLDFWRHVGRLCQRDVGFISHPIDFFVRVEEGVEIGSRTDAQKDDKQSKLLQKAFHVFL